jgi:hypothetical protein
MRTRIATGVVLVLGAIALAGCGGGASATTTASPTTTALAVADRQACALLFARLQRVTVALQTSSELIAHSRNKGELGRRIAIEQVQLERSADLMREGPVPERLASADRRLVSALRALSQDFARARRPAARGDFQAAVDAMSDPQAISRIVSASKTIERACR